MYSCLTKYTCPGAQEKVAGFQVQMLFQAKMCYKTFHGLPVDDYPASPEDEGDASAGAPEAAALGAAAAGAPPEVVLIRNHKRRQYTYNWRAPSGDVLLSMWKAENGRMNGERPRAACPDAQDDITCPPLMAAIHLTTHLNSTGSLCCCTCRTTISGHERGTLGVRNILSRWNDCRACCPDMLSGKLAAQSMSEAWDTAPTQGWWRPTTTCQSSSRRSGWRG
jgi:hypothetical protein